MKFLLELVSCCGSNPPTSSAKEETRSLVGWVSPRRAGRVRGVKRGRSGRNGSSVGEWRPSLSSISEDNVLYERNELEEAAASAVSPAERNFKRKVVSTPKARSRSNGENAGRPSVQAMMPTFSPAPFMF